MGGVVVVWPWVCWLERFRFFGGYVNTVLRITDVFLAFPKLILALAFVSALGPGIENAVLAIALTAWPPYARISRAETLTVRNADYIAAARLKGISNSRLIRRHVMPMCTSSVIIRVTLDMAGIILTAAGLGFWAWGRNRRRRNGAPWCPRAASICWSSGGSPHFQALRSLW